MGFLILPLESTCPLVEGLKKKIKIIPTLKIICAFSIFPEKNLFKKFCNIEIILKLSLYLIFKWLFCFPNTQAIQCLV